MERQLNKLLESETPDYARTEYDAYVSALIKAREVSTREYSKVRWLIDPEKVRQAFLRVHALGAYAFEKGESRKIELAVAVGKDIVSLGKKIQTQKKLTLKTVQGKIAREKLIRAKSALLQAASLHKKKQYLASQNQLKTAEDFLGLAENDLNRVLWRYNNSKQLKKWRTDVGDAIRRSKISGELVIIIKKVEGTLSLYKKGQLIRTYSVGIGRDGLRDKAYAGDKATPEGTYRIVRKLEHSQFYKALVINYPNSSDIKVFNAKKKNGLLPRSAAIGSMIEIHGGGKNLITDGCIGLDNKDIEELFDLVQAGNAVTIVGFDSNEISLSEWLGTH